MTPPAPPCELCHEPVGGRTSISLTCSRCGTGAYHHDCLHDAYFRLIQKTTSGGRRNDSLNRLRSNNFSGLHCVHSSDGCCGHAMDKEWIDIHKKPKKKNVSPAKAKVTVPDSSKKDKPCAQRGAPLILVKAIATIQKQQTFRPYVLFEKDGWPHSVRDFRGGADSLFSLRPFWDRGITA